MTTLDLKIDGYFTHFPRDDQKVEFMKIDFTGQMHPYGISIITEGGIEQDLQIIEFIPVGGDPQQMGYNIEYFHIKFDNCKSIIFDPESTDSKTGDLVSDRNSMDFPVLHLEQLDSTKPITINLTDDNGKIIDHMDIYPNEYSAAAIDNLDQIDLSNLTSIIHLS